MNREIAPRASVAINARNLVRALALALFVVPVAAAHASTFKVLHTFTGDDGCNPVAGPILDGVGNLYGTTAGGLCQNDAIGTVFELEPDGTEIILHAFTGGNNGEGPDDTLVMDKRGNLYGATLLGGSIGCGVIFKVAAGGTEKTLHDFAGAPNDGCLALGSMIIGANGNLYGTTSGGGKGRAGTVFELTLDGVATLLHSFCPREPPHCGSGESSNAALVADAAGNLYSTTEAGGSRRCSSGCGIVFELAADNSETVLYKFKGPPSDGSNSGGALIIDASGNLYGTLFYGGISGCHGDAGCGAVFKLVPDGTETVLHLFTGKNGDGANPITGLIANSKGDLYGTTEYGGGSGCDIGCGTVFEIAPDGTETILHKFKESTDGANPMGGLVADAAGNLYGTAYAGGSYGYGTVFEITP
jgi:uncharacterized repeat protein (TIGR03803 family)